MYFIGIFFSFQFLIFAQLDLSDQRRINLSKDISEILIDKNKDGVADFWEVEKNNLTITVTIPINGTYQQIELRKKNPHSLELKRYFYSENSKKYFLFSKQEEKNVTLRSSDAFICRDNDSNFELWKDFLGDYNQYQESSALQHTEQQIEKAKYNLFDQSCFNSTFKSSYPLMKKALALVFISGRFQGDQPKQLSCMYNNQLSEYAARIEKVILERLQGLKSPFIKCEKIKEDFIGSSEPWKSITLHKTTSEIGKGEKICELSQSVMGVMLEPSCSYKKNNLSAEENAINNYTETLLHELIHFRGNKNEAHVYAIENCCGKGQPEESASCQSMKEINWADQESNTGRLILVKSQTKDLNYESSIYQMKQNCLLQMSCDHLEKMTNYYVGESFIENNSVYAKQLDDLSIELDDRIQSLEKFAESIVLDLDPKISKLCESIEMRKSVNKSEVCEEYDRKILEMARRMAIQRGVGESQVCMSPNSFPSVEEILSSKKKVESHWLRILLGEWTHAETALSSISGKAAGPTCPFNPMPEIIKSENVKNQSATGESFKSKAAAPAVESTSAKAALDISKAVPVSENLGVPSQGMQLGQKESRTDFAAHTRRASALYDFAEKTLSQIGHELRPVAQAKMPVPTVSALKKSEALKSTIHPVSISTNSILTAKTETEVEKNVELRKAKSDSHLLPKRNIANIQSVQKTIPNRYQSPSRSAAKSTRGEATSNYSQEEIFSILNGDANGVNIQLKNSLFLMELINYKITVINELDQKFGSESGDIIYRYSLSQRRYLKQGQRK